MFSVCQGPESPPACLCGTKSGEYVSIGVYPNDSNPGFTHPVETGACNNEIHYDGIPYKPYTPQKLTQISSDP